MTQEHLNHFIVLHGHKNLSDRLSPIIEIAQSFFGASERRQISLGSFKFEMGV